MSKPSIERYGALWPADLDALGIELGCIRKGGKWKTKAGKECGAGLFEHYMNARKLLWPDRYRHKWTETIYKTILENSVIVMMGCACVSGRTRILNPLTGESPTIKELYENGIAPTVMTLEGPKQASVPFIKGVDDLFEVVLDNGNRFEATAKHRVLTPGGYRSLDSLSVGETLLAYDECRPASNSGTCQSVQPLGDPCLTGTTQGSLFDCPTGYRFCDEPLRLGPEIFQDASPSQVGAQTHPYRAYSHTDGRDTIFSHTRPFSHAFRPSTYSDLAQVYTSGNADLVHALEGIFERASRLFQRLWQSQPMKLLRSSFLKLSSCVGSRRYPCEVGPLHSSSSYNVIHCRVLSIRKTQREAYYDLSVPGPEHYFAEGAIHHNSSQKTSHAAEYVLISYWARPENTVCLVTTVNIEKLEMAVFGEIKKLWRDGRDRYDWLAGNLIEHKHAISTDSLEDGEVRDLRRGIIGRPCYVGKQEVGLGVFAGIKQEHIIFLADELQFMSPTFLGVLPNMFSNPDVKVIGSGNPNHNPDTQLGIAAEPVGGWSSLPEPEKTTVWKTNFFDGVCLNLVGTDSPNFDGPADQPDKYHRLIGRRFARQIENTYGPSSPEFYTQVKGVMRIDMAHSRVITRELCRQHHALEKAIWKDNIRTRVLGVDPAYGGGDRAISICVEFGKSADDRLIIRVVGYRTIPINLKRPESAEDQIAEGVAKDVADYGIPIENCFYDSFGKGTVGFAFARKFGSKSPIPVDPGGKPSKRPVRQDLFIYDEARKEKRLKTCQEHYSKFVTELWFSVRYAIEAQQLRELPEEIMHEGCMREYTTVAGDKIEVEPKADMRERLGKSPDLFDALAIATEGARQRGFTIDRLGEDKNTVDDGDDWFEREQEKHDELLESKLLTH